MEIKKTTSGNSSVQTKPASQKPSSEAKKAAPPVTAEKTSAPSEKISTEDKYEKETKSDKKEEFFDNVSDLRSMSEKDSLKKEEKPEKLDKEKERKNLLTSLLSVSRDALKLAKSALNKLSSCGDSMPDVKTDDKSDPSSVINKAALEVPEDTKKLWDNLCTMTAAEVKDNVATSEKKGEEKLAEDTVKEFQNKYEELRKGKTVEYNKEASGSEKTAQTGDKTSQIGEKTVQTGEKTTQTDQKTAQTDTSAQAKYDPAKEAEVLNNAMSGWGVNKDAIYNLLKGKSPEELKSLKENYKSKYGKDLEEVVKSELKGGELDKAKALLEKGKLSDADNIKQALGGWNITKGDIVKTLDGKSADEIKAIKEEYKKTYGTELDKDLDNTLLMTSSEKDKIKFLMTGEPQPDMSIKDPKERETDLIKRKGEFTATRIALDIAAIGTSPIKTYERRALLDTLYGKSPEEIKAYKEAYKKHTGEELDKKLDSFLLFPSDSERALVKSYMTQGKETDAESLHRAMAGAGANANLIFKTLEGKSDAERKAIIGDYKKKYGKDLPGDLKEQLGGANLEKAQALLEKGPCYELKGEKLKSTIPPDKLKLIEKNILNKEFSEKDLREKLTKSGFNEQEIETVLKDSKKDNLDSNTKLNVAMDRWGADKQAIFDTLQEASPETRQAILNNKDMMKKLEGELNDKDYAQAMGYLNSNKSGEVPLKDKLKSSMAGWGTDKNSLYEALDKASPEEIASLKSDPEMNKLFDSELNKEDREKLNNIIKEGKVSSKTKIKNALSFWGEDEKKIYEALEKATPEERKNLMNDPEIKEIFSKNLDAREMSNVNLIMEKGKLPAKTKIEQASKGAGTIEKDIFEALEKATPEERKELQKDPSIKKLLEEELGGNDLLRAQILLEKGKTEPVDDLYMAMKGAGTDRDAIYKALSSCKNNEEKDKLINTYRNKYNRDLQADLREELAGTDYYKAFDMLQKEPKNLEERKEQMTEKLSRGRNNGDIWTEYSNGIMDVFSEEGRNVDDSERELRDTYKQVEKIEKQGGKPDAKLLEKLDKVENKVRVNIDDYEESKNKVADGLSTAASITAAVATSAVVTLATGGAGAVTVPLIIGSAITCATTKVAINKIVKGNSYDLNSTQALTDFTTGAVEGALNVAGGPLMDKFCKLPVVQKAAVMSTIMKNPVIAKALSKSTIEGVNSFMENKAVQEIVKDAITDAVTSGVQGGLTTAMDESTWTDGIGEGLLKVGESGAVQGGAGLATSVVMGTTLKAGEHILGKLKPKADTLDGLEVKLKDPEKFSKAKEILSEGSHSEADLAERLKKAGFKDEDIQSVLEHKSSIKTAEKPVTEEPSVKEDNKETAGEVKETESSIKKTDINEASRKDLHHEGMGDEDISSEIFTYDIKGTPKTALETIKDIKENAKENILLKIDNMSVPFYGTKEEARLIEKALNQLPNGIKDKLGKPKNFVEKFLAFVTGDKSTESLIKGIYVSNDTIFKKLDGTICEGTKGVCILPTGEIILYPQVLNKDLLIFQEKHAADSLFNQIKDKSLEELKDMEKNLRRESTTLSNNSEKLEKLYDYNKNSMSKIDQKKIKELKELEAQYNEIDNYIKMMNDYGNGNLKNLDKKFIKEMDSYSDDKLDSLWKDLHHDRKNIRADYNKISGENTNLIDQVNKLESILKKIEFEKNKLSQEIIEKDVAANMLSAYTHQIEGASERWFDTFNHEVFHRLDYLKGKKIIGKNNVIRIDKNRLNNFPGISEETKKKLGLLLDRDIPYGTQKQLKDHLESMGIDGKEANIIMEKFKLETTCFSEKAPDTPFYNPATHNISPYASKSQSASETSAETFKSLMKEWRNYDNPHDIQGFLRALRDMCDSDATWEQYVFIVNNYLEKDLPELRYIRDSRSHENILNNIIEVNKKILKLSDKREGKITYSGSDTGERKIPQRGSDTGNRKVIQSRTSPVEPSWEGNKKKIQDFETVESKVPVSDRTEYIPSSDASETLIPDEASPQGSIEITDIAQGGKKSFTPRELKEFRERWIIPIKNK